MFEKDPRTFSPEYKNLSPEQKAMVKLEITLSQFFKAFDKSVGRWERMIYPAIIIFGLLGLSGFYLIYHVTKDMHIMAQNVDPNMESNLGAMSGHIEKLSKNIATMTSQITVLVSKIENMDNHIAHMDTNIGGITSTLNHMGGNIDLMTKNLTSMTDNISLMTGNIATMSENFVTLDRSVNVMTGNLVEMNRSMKIMTSNTGVMSHDINKASRPMNMMNSFMPW